MEERRSEKNELRPAEKQRSPGSCWGGRRGVLTPSRSLDQRVYQDFLFKLYTLTVNEIYDEYPKINALAELTRLR